MGDCWWRAVPASTEWKSVLFLSREMDCWIAWVPAVFYPAPWIWKRITALFFLNEQWEKYNFNKTPLHNIVIKMMSTLYFIHKLYYQNIKCLLKNIIFLVNYVIIKTRHGLFAIGLHFLMFLQVKCVKFYITVVKAVIQNFLLWDHLMSLECHDEESLWGTDIKWKHSLHNQGAWNK